MFKEIKGKILNYKWRSAQKRENNNDLMRNVKMIIKYENLIIFINKYMVQNFCLINILQNQIVTITNHYTTALHLVAVQ